MNVEAETRLDLAALLPDDLGQPLAFGKGDLLFAEGDRTHGLFRVGSGLIRLVRHAVDGSSVTLHVARSGGVFAEASLFSEVYHCDAIADKASEVLLFDKSKVLGALRGDAGHALGWIQHLSRQVQALRAQAACLSLNTAEERVLAFVRAQCLTEPKVILDRSWKAVASELGLTHEALYRALARLEKRGALKRDRAASSIELIADRSRRRS